MKIMLPKYIKVGKKTKQRQVEKTVKKAMAPIVGGKRDKEKDQNFSRAVSRIGRDLALAERKNATNRFTKSMQKILDRMKYRQLKKLALPQKSAKEPYHHQQFTPAMKRAVLPILAKAVETGEMDNLTCMRAESEINKSIREPNFQISQPLLAYLIKKLTKKTQSQTV